MAVSGPEEIGHHTAFAGDRAFAERVQVLPRDQVGRAVQERQAGQAVLVGATEQQVPIVAFSPDVRAVPPSSWPPNSSCGQDRVAGVLAPVDEVVGSGGHALAQAPYAVLERERLPHQTGVEDVRHPSATTVQPF